MGASVWSPTIGYGDQYLYLDLARSLASGLGFQLSQHQAFIVVPGQPTGFWTPGLPLTLALGIHLGGVTGAVLLWRALALAAGVGGVVAVERLGSAAGGPLAGAIAAWVWALFPARLLAGVMVLAEPVYIPLVVAAIALATRPSTRRCAAAGVLLMGAFWLRGEAVLVAVVLGAMVCVLVRARGGRVAVVLGAALLAPAAVSAGAWTVRNSLAIGEATIETRADYNLWVRLDASTRSFPYAGWLEPWMGAIVFGDSPPSGRGQGAGDQVQQQATDIAAQLSEGERAAALRGDALSHLRAHPLDVARHIGYEASALLYPRAPSGGGTGQRTASGYWPAILSDTAGWIASLLVVAAALLWAFASAWRRTDPLVIAPLLALIALHSVLLVLGASPNDVRQRLRLDVFLLVLGAALLARLISGRRATTQQGRGHSKGAGAHGILIH